MRHRSGNEKIVMGRHSTIHKGLRKLLDKIAEWPEVANIQVNETNKSRKKSRTGGHTFRVTRAAVVGGKHIGYKCVSTHGTSNQEVVINASQGNVPALKRRLIAAGYLDNS